MYRQRLAASNSAVVRGVNPVYTCDMAREKTMTVLVRASPIEVRKIKRAAHAYGEGVSTFMRRLALEAAHAHDASSVSAVGGATRTASKGPW